ncbi:Hypothetical protein NTJ_06183 [Nesidiocoris tenuis]|uniref:Uncharacterized protein n=1 Tax=Nesidiocoris tenuis TaxID=355587 RepID=A0ABN7AQ10_9HEMI|nr:Hypothetical protein NTJ_06183 [Nesidiocoris tenuis]
MPFSLSLPQDVVAILKAKMVSKYFHRMPECTQCVLNFCHSAKFCFPCNGRLPCEKRLNLRNCGSRKSIIRHESWWNGVVSPPGVGTVIRRRIVRLYTPFHRI